MEKILRELADWGCDVEEQENDLWMTPNYI